MAGGGIIWTPHAATVDYPGLWQLRLLAPGSVEVCAPGILIWLHAKSRHAGKA
jgi:hypothetical protein